MRGTCSTKTAYKRQRDAEASAAKHSRRMQINFHAYRCQICENWHMTTQKLVDRSGGQLNRLNLNKF